MKPLNYDSQGCNPISSNCIIWQGPDIECIKLCKGDSVSVVVYKLAEELCSLLDKFNISQYDLSCLNLNACAPEDIQQLIQLLINKICELESCCNQNNPNPTTGCPDCVVNICEEFQYTNQLGDLITTMQLTDYVQAIGNRVCQLIGQINTINATLQNHEERITYIEQNCCDDTPTPLPLITPTCVLPTSPQVPLDVLLQVLEKQFCELRSATGTPNDIYLAIFKQCAGLDSAPKLTGIGTMASIPGWETSVNDLSDAISNLWLTVCDIRSAVTNIKTNCCPGGCDDVSVSISGSLNWPYLTLNLVGNIPSGFQSCDPLGTLFTFEDGLGNIKTEYVNVLLNINSSVNIDLTGLNSASNITVSASFCFYNDSEGYIECNSTASFIVTSSFACPTLSATPAEISISYSFVAPSAGTYKTQISTSPTFSSILSENVAAPPTPQLLLGAFNGLNPATTYYLRNLVTIGESETTCPATQVTTLAPICGNPTDASGVIQLP